MLVGTAVMLHRGGAVWLAQRLDPKKPYYGLWCSPGGTVEPGETPIQCAIRELIEETGLVLSPERLGQAQVLRCSYPDGTHFLMHCFVVQLLSTEVLMRREPLKLGDWTPCHAASLKAADLTPATLAGLRQLPE